MKGELECLGNSLDAFYGCSIHKFHQIRSTKPRCSSPGILIKILLELVPDRMFGVEFSSDSGLFSFITGGVVDLVSTSASIVCCDPSIGREESIFAITKNTNLFITNNCKQSIA